MDITVRHDLWNQDKTLVLSLPSRWNTQVLAMGGDGKEALTHSDYRKAVQPLASFIKGKKEVCILFDDLSRPTRTYEILPSLLELFQQCGIMDEQVRFICALGTHAPLDNAAFRKKLGNEVMERFPVYNHNPYENCELIGRTRQGTPVIVNKEYLSCDLKVGIGALIPHSFCGFGGGYKIVMPAVSHIDAIEYHHGTLLKKYWDACYGIGKYQGNPLLEDIKECGRMAGLDAVVNVMVNTGALATDVYAGNPDGLYREMTEKAAQHYRTPTDKKADIVIANAYGKASEAVIALSLAEEFLKDEGGDVVILCDIEEGQVVHYLLGRFGKDTWGRLAFGERKKSGKTKRVHIYSRRRDLANECWFGKKEDLLWHKNLEDMIDHLDDQYRDREVDVLVIPDGTIQMI
jgi:nickel-dependent lactate racemase